MKSRILRDASVLLAAMLCEFPMVDAQEKKVYRLSVRKNRHLRRKMVTVEAPSFSGDIGEIMEAAEEKAYLEDNQNGGGATTEAPPSTVTPPSSTQGPTTSNGADSSCVTGDSDYEYLSYTYEMETLPSSAPLDGRDIIVQDHGDVQDDLENTLNTALEDELLDCPDSGYNGNSGIVQFDPLPRDTPDQDSSCDPNYITDSANTCQVMVGVMKVSFKPDVTDPTQVEDLVLTATEKYLNSINDDTIDGVARTRYLGPSNSNPDGATDGNEPSGGEPAETASDSGLNHRSIIFMSLASVGFVAAVGLVTYYRLRKPRRDEEVPYVATLENESSGEESPSRLDSSCDDLSQSQFSQIMPSNYRFDGSDSPFQSPFDSVATSMLGPSSMGPSSMGTIHESDDANSSDGGIVISDTGYSSTEDSSVEFPYFESNYVANGAPVLGARPRTGEELEESIEDVPF